MSRHRRSRKNRAAPGPQPASAAPDPAPSGADAPLQASEPLQASKPAGTPLDGVVADLPLQGAPAAPALGADGPLGPDAPPPAPAPGAAPADADGPGGKLALLLRRPLGMPLAFAAMGAGAMAAALAGMGEPAASLLLPVAALLLGLSAVFPAKVSGAAAEEPARLRLIAVTLGLVVALLVLTTVEAFALLSLTGRLFTIQDLRAVVRDLWPVLLGLLAMLGALGRLAASQWAHALAPSPRQRRIALVLAALTLLPATIVTALYLAPGDQPAVTQGGLPFVAAPALILGLGAFWAGTLPRLHTLSDWLTTLSRRDQARAAKNITAGLAVGALGGAVAGLAAWVVAGPSIGAPMLGLGLALAITASFPAGLARYVPPLSVADPEALLERRRKALTLLLAASLASMALAVAGLLAWMVTPDDSILPALLLVAGVALQAGIPVASAMAPIPGQPGKGRAAAAWYLAMGALLLVVFALLVGTGLAQGPNVAASTAVMTLAAAALANAGNAVLRLALPPPREKPKRAEEEAGRRGAPMEFKEQVTRTMHLAYVAGLGFSVVMVGLVATTSMGVVDIEASTGVPSGLLVALVALAGVPVVGFFAWRYLQAKQVEVSVRRAQESQYKRRLTAQEVTRLTILGASVSIAVMFIVMGLLVQFQVLRTLGPLELEVKYSTDFFVFAILAGLGPYGFMRARELGRRAAIDARFPELLRDLAESKRAGMTLTQAVVTAAKGSYGALTPDVRKMAAQIEWGVSFGEALTRFGQRVRTPLIERSVSLIVQASEAGGSVEDVLRAAADDARELQLLLNERRTSMSIYVMIIYIAFFVFLSVIAILDAQFLPEVAKAVKGAKGVSVGPITFGEIDVAAFEQVFFHAAIIQAVGGGFVAGVMAEGRPEAGLRHVFVMVIVGYIMFRFLIGG